LTVALNASNDRDGGNVNLNRAYLAICKDTDDLDVCIRGNVYVPDESITLRPCSGNISVASYLSNPGRPRRRNPCNRNIGPGDGICIADKARG
jgi:hypothetical protein